MTLIEVSVLPFACALVLLWIPPFIPSDLRRRLTDPARLSFPTFRGMIRVWSNWLDLVRGVAGALLLTSATFHVSPGSSDKVPEQTQSRQSDVSGDIASKASSARGFAMTFVILHSEAGDAAKAEKAGPTPTPPPLAEAVTAAKTPDEETPRPLPRVLVAVEFAAVLAGLLIQMIHLRRGVVFFAPIFYLCGVTLVQPDFLIGGAVVAVGWLIALAAKSPIYQLPVMGVAVGIAGLLLASLKLMVHCAIVLAPIILALLWQKRLVYVSRSHSVAHRT
jgi:hypothetical protein